MTGLRRFLILLLAALTFFSVCTAEEPAAEEVLKDLLTASRKYRTQKDIQKVRDDIGQISNPILLEAAVHWKELFIDPGYKLFKSGRDKPQKLEIPDPAKHGFVVLGFCLKDGKMLPELAGRCKAAATAAKAYPDTLIVCTGGATGSNNPDRNTEAGLMRNYLVNSCGISPDRILTDPDAMTTEENALNSLRMLSEKGVETVTVVTSVYHIRWANVLFYTAAAWYREQGIPMEIIGNWCYNVDPAPGYDGVNYSIAMAQLEGMLLSGPNALLRQGEQIQEATGEADEAD